MEFLSLWDNWQYNWWKPQWKIIWSQDDWPYHLRWVRKYRRRRKHGAGEWPLNHYRGRMTIHDRSRVGKIRVAVKKNLYCHRQNISSQFASNFTPISVRFIPKCLPLEITGFTKRKFLIENWSFDGTLLLVKEWKRFCFFLNFYYYFFLVPATAVDFILCSVKIWMF